MGEDGTRTIFVYLCGTDLESDGGFATYDLQEMLDASTDSNVKFVLQTGGTYDLSPSFSRWIYGYSPALQTAYPFRKQPKS